MPDINTTIDRLQGQPSQSPQQGNSRAMTARLLALLPIAMARGGRAAVTGLLSGYQQGLQQQQQQGQQYFTNQRLLAQDARAEAAEARAEGQFRITQQDAEARRIEREREAFLAQAQAMGAVDQSPEAAMTALSQMGPQASRLGVSQVALEQNFAVTPSQAQVRKLRGILDRVDREWKGKADPDQIDAMAVSDPNANGMKVGEIRALVGGLAGVPKTTPKNAPAVGSFEDYSTATPERKAQIERDRKAYMQADDRPRVTVNTGGLPARTQTAVNSIARGWDSLPIVKTVQKQAEAVDFSERLDVNTKNPADDQALIYAFAKAMDPDSVVREGEYATVQRYGQSWAEAFGFNLARIFTNTAFLTPQARANMKKTIRARYQAGLNQYTNARRSYESKINKLTGGTDGGEYLTDYAGGFPGGQAQAVPGPAPPAGAASYQDYLKSKGGP